MLTAVERVLILKGADLLRELGPRHLLELAEVAREVELTAGEPVFQEDDAADALYIVVEGRVRLSTNGRTTSEVGPAESFGTWALVDDSSRDQRAECTVDGLALALHRDAFYDVAAGDLALLQEVVRALARRLRTLVTERPDEARVEGEGVEKPEAMIAAEAVAAGEDAAAAKPAAGSDAAPTAGAALEAAALGRPATAGSEAATEDAARPPEPASASAETTAPENHDASASPAVAVLPTAQAERAAELADPTVTNI